MPSPRRYVAVIQDPRGYPEPGAYEDDLTTVTIHEVVLREDHEVVAADRDRYRQALLDVRAEFDSPSDTDDPVVQIVERALSQDRDA